MSLWIDKYRPKTFEDLTIHPKLTKRLKKISSTKDIPHLLFYGPSGSGKKTRILCLLRDLYGPDVDHVHSSRKDYKFKSGGTAELSILSSSYHIELNPSDVGVKDRKVIQETLKEIAQTTPISSYTSLKDMMKKGTKKNFFQKQKKDENKKEKEKEKENEKEKKTNKIGYRVVILNEVDLLTREAQQALRRTMEKYTKTCRLILVCVNVSAIIEPLRSRCLLIRVPAPNKSEVQTLLEGVVKRQKLNAPTMFLKKIVNNSDLNIRRAILMLQSAKIDQYPFKEHQFVPLPDWQIYIADLARSIVEEPQSPKQLLVIRNKLYELITHCIPTDVIFSVLLQELLLKVDTGLQKETISLAAYYEHKSKLGSKPIIHLEAFISHFMVIFKKFLTDFY
ncbi:replication factor c subunit [Anaeramoeba flamelloides]|uniref:Replication factor c subunit n=1 Tax=Anaeramoeba flamelloides TaxID=1746091 RepID=A0AAV7YWX1_9EUKA|nr:replication factor c subunit [Anaeramoeba flamelloides]